MYNKLQYNRKRQARIIHIITKELNVCLGGFIINAIKDGNLKKIFTNCNLSDICFEIKKNKLCRK